jgi:hypothetical protein
MLFSVYFGNIHEELLRAQRYLVRKFAPAYTHIQWRTEWRHPPPGELAGGWTHALAIDEIFGLVHPPERVLMLLDIDCIPLYPGALGPYVEFARAGALAGHAQRANHLDNGAHVYVGPPLLALTYGTWQFALGAPSARCTMRADVCEEWTFRAERARIPVHYQLPERFDCAPFDGRRNPERMQSWPLGPGQPHFGVGTTYRTPYTEREGTWHMFETQAPDGLERFLRKCNEVAEATS